MNHVDPDELALLALGEDATAEVQAHLADCPECAQQLVELGHVAEIGRGSRPIGLEAPPPAVWERIRAELALELSSAAEPLPVLDASSAAGPQPAPALDALAAVEPLPDPATPVAVDQPGESATAVPPGRHQPDRRRRHRPRRLTAVVAALAALVVGVAGGAWWQAARDDGGVVIARADLAAFPGWPGASGTAELEDADGERRLVVHLDAASDGDAYREVWLIASDASGLVGLGVLDGSTGRFTVPADVDLSRYSLVDVSEEPLDGDPAHSGDSIVRGPLREPPREG